MSQIIEIWGDNLLGVVDNVLVEDWGIQEKIRDFELLNSFIVPFSFPLLFNRLKLKKVKY